QLERTIEAMIAHCETRGGGLAVALIQLSLPAAEDEAPVKIPKGTLRSISHAIQLALRPLDLIARYDNHTFAIALTYAQQDNFQPEIFERSIASILKHNNQKTDQGRDLQVSMSFVVKQVFEPIPEVADILQEVEEGLQPLEMTNQEY
ncbi:MAG: diguanylate cyclase, partial [Gammaproteobacteria bacterium]|nr:diguanylate cyclase [Gammaproteobacteria bacterium]